MSNEVASIHFDLEAHSLDQALKIALEGCEAIGIEIKRIELLPEEAFGLETA
ncbi:MAG: hypothetical protein J0L94_04385 [Rhodothermia bacterium]|nr:hypothetical protein [Rhodothermia bacterium]